ncbi:MAG: hypothetical protein OXJ64_14710 [Boseongicola sp.]|nr:hypothetical protein [Boseongicola sp.]
MILKTLERARALGINQSAIGRLIGESQGLILRTLLEKTGIGRIAVAGSDTCSHALRQLEIHSLKLLMPAAPLCLAFSDNPAFDKLQVASKGGQIGAPDYFVQVLEGRKS